MTDYTRHVVLYYSRDDKLQTVPLDIWKNLRRKDKTYFRSVGVFYIGEL